MFQPDEDAKIKFKNTLKSTLQFEGHADTPLTDLNDLYEQD